MSSTTPLAHGLADGGAPDGAWQRLAAVARAADVLAAEARSLVAEARAALAEVPNDVALAASASRRPTRRSPPWHGSATPRPRCR